jgi:hypothetical protein
MVACFQEEDGGPFRTFRLGAKVEQKVFATSLVLTF